MVCCGPKMVGLLSRGDMGPRGPCWHGWCPGKRLKELCGLPGAQTSRGAGEAQERGTPATQPAPMTQGRAVRGCFPGRVGGLGQPLLGGSGGGAERKKDTQTGPRVTSFMGQAKCNAKLFLFFFF